MKPPRSYKVNGYSVMELKAGWEVWNSDKCLKGPFDSEEDARQAAKELPPKG